MKKHVLVLSLYLKQVLSTVASGVAKASAQLFLFLVMMVVRVLHLKLSL